MSLNIITSKTGIQKQTFKLKAPQRDGLILKVHHTTLVKGLPQKIRFTQICFDNMGMLLAAINHKGNILVLDLVNNKFWTAPTFHSCTVLKFSPLNDCEVLFGATNGQIHILNIETAEVISTLNGHKYPIMCLSFSKDYYCLSCSGCEAILWDLKSNTQLQVLNVAEDASLKYICFMPVTNNVLACFNDDTMQVWKYGTFESFKKILPSSWNKCAIKCVAITRNGRAMVVGGHTSQLAIFLLDIWEYTKTISLPEYIQTVKYLDFISQPFDGGSNKILSILSGNGVLYFYNMEKNYVMNKVTAIQEITKFSFTFDGKYLACTLSTGEINIYSLSQYISSKVNTPEALETNKKKANKNMLVQIKKSPTTISNAQLQMEQILDLEKLQKILKEYGAYPDIHRLKIWSKLLQLPHNQEEYNIINKNVCKTPFDCIDKDYPLENKIALKNLKKVLINLCTWCPLFSHVKYLPVLVFPFVRVFQNEPILCFEAISTILINLCQHWFEYFPIAPINVLAIMENVLLEHDIELLRYFNQCNVTSETYAWSLLEVVFSESLSSDCWRTFWDHVLSNEPAFLLLAVVAYNILNRSSLLCLEKLEEFQFFYHNQNPINVKKLIIKTYHLLNNTTEKNHPRQYLNSFKSLGTETYPMFSDFPKAILDIKSKDIEELNIEEDIVRLEREKIERLREMRKEQIDAAKRSEVENQRLKALEQICKEKVREEYDRIQEERKKLALIRKELSEEEALMGAISSNKILATSVKERQSVIEDLLYHIDRSRGNNEIEVIKAETELLKHYSELLRCRIQIEDLLDSEEPSQKSSVQLQLQQQQQILMSEIDKIQHEINSRKYLKHLSIATGIAAVDSLIHKIEKEIGKPATPKESMSNNDYKMTKLKTESYELELRVTELLDLIRTHTKFARSKYTDSSLPGKKCKSLSNVDEILLNMKDINSMSDIKLPKYDTSDFRGTGHPPSPTIFY